MTDKKNKETDTGELIATNFKLSVSLGIIFLIILLMIPILNEFAKNFMLTDVFGNFTVTYIYTAILVFVIGWIIPLYYTLKTDKREEEYNDDG
ncbi:MAG: DUF485 domain-containing protein [Methanobacteriaceae archaeon]|nr:DUF485 domain-containing protein [Methanobacteriaceae archaeon]